MIPSGAVAGCVVRISDFRVGAVVPFQLLLMLCFCVHRTRCFRVCLDISPGGRVPPGVLLTPFFSFFLHRCRRKRERRRNMHTFEYGRKGPGDDELRFVYRVTQIVLHF